jgi:hypothetical protein
MAQSKEMQWIPSGGVLAVAIGAALVAAILVNVYIGRVRSQYEVGSKQFFQLRDPVAKGNPIQKNNLVRVPIPRILEPAFKRAAEDDDNGRLLIGRKAPRDMSPGEFLWYNEFKEEGAGKIRIIRPGYELITIPIAPDNPLGQQLEVGAYVNIFGEFDIGSDPKKPQIEIKKVMENVQVKALGGSAESVTQTRRTYDNIQIEVQPLQAKQLFQIQMNLLKGSRRFTLTLAGQGEGEPVISKEVQNLLEKPRGAAAPALLPPPE